MRSEQIQDAIEKFIAGGGEIQVLPPDNQKFFFPSKSDPFEDLVDKFAFNIFEEDERFDDILD